MDYGMKQVRFKDEKTAERFVALYRDLFILWQTEQELRERIAKLSEPLLTDVRSHRTPETIKRDIKHEKNPMRLKQLNQELNSSYKFYKGGIK